MDALCACSCFPELNWNWSEKCPPVHIYCADMWDDNFIPHVYELCDLFLGSMYCKFLKLMLLHFMKKLGNLFMPLVCRRIFLLHKDLGQQYSALASENCSRPNGASRIFLLDCD